MLNILLVDDHELFREGVKLLLADLAEDLAFATAARCEEALLLSAQRRFDIVLLDFHLPGLQGLPALAALRERAEQAVIVVLSAEDDPALILQAIDAGAAGFIPKNSSHAVMLAALRLILAGGIYLPPHAFLASVPAPVPVPAPAAVALPLPAAPLPATAGAGGSSIGTVSASAPLLTTLSQRQIETLRLAIQGKSNKVIAREMDISEATVKAHLSASFRALGVRNRTEAVFAAARYGITL